jgi:hypothetical protein
MFPTISENSENEIQSTREKVISTSSELGKTPNIEFEKKSLTIENGTPKLVTDVDAIRQWITLFVTTPKNTYKIYNGTNFGTSIRKLFGRKILNNGYEEAEVEREIREGLPLCPAINRVTSFNMEKVGKILKVYVGVELFDGELINETIEVSYLVR